MNMDKPFNRVNLFNSALPAANNNILTGAGGIATNPVGAFNCDPALLRIYICVSIAGILTLTRTVGATTMNELLNNGVALTAKAAYIFDVAIRGPYVSGQVYYPGEIINLQYSTTTGTINKLQIDETWSG